MSSRKRTAIVVLNFRTAELTVQCVRTLFDEVDPQRDRIIIVDNASGDDSVERLNRAVAEERWADRVDVVASDRNDGFASGNNIGIRAVDADSYLLINSDTQVRPGSVAKLREALTKDATIGIVGPRLEWPDGRVQISGFRHHSPAAEFIRTAGTRPVDWLLRRYVVSLEPSPMAVDCDWVSFACVLVRRQVLETVGLLDEGYFLYYEDADYCRRAWAAGWRVVYWPEARVVHLRGGSGPVKALGAAKRRRPRYFYEARSRYFRKFYGTSGLWGANLLWHAGRALSYPRELIGQRGPGTCEREALDIWTDAFLFSRQLGTKKDDALVS